MEQPILSIIIPVYNVEMYIERCINSIVSQKPYLQNKIEIILIDDGSIDSSGEICDELADKYVGITVLHKKNGGLSFARNTGIKASKGKYIQLLDSDDTLEPDALELIISALINEPDILICRFNEIDLKNGAKKECSYHLNRDIVVTSKGEMLLEQIITGRTYNWYAWINVISSHFLKENNLYFNEGRCFEDVLWTPKIINEARSVNYLDKPIYNYYINRSGSITKQISEKVYRDKINAVRFIKDFCLKNNFSKQLSDKMMGNMSQIYVSLLADSRLFSAEKRNRYLEDIKKYDLCLKYSPQKYKRILYKLELLIGINGVSYVLHKSAQYVRRKNNI